MTLASPRTQSEKAVSLAVWLRSTVLATPIRSTVWLCLRFGPGVQVPKDESIVGRYVTG